MELEPDRELDPCRSGGGVANILDREGSGIELRICKPQIPCIAAKDCQAVLSKLSTPNLVSTHDESSKYGTVSKARWYFTVQCSWYCRVSLSIFNFFSSQGVGAALVKATSLTIERTLNPVVRTWKTYLQTACLDEEIRPTKFHRTCLRKSGRDAQKRTRDIITGSNRQCDRIIA